MMHFTPTNTNSNARRPTQALESYWSSTVRHLPPGECEVLYGRGGYLYSLLWTEQQLGPGAISSGVVQVSWPAGYSILGVVQGAHQHGSLRLRAAHSWLLQSRHTRQAFGQRLQQHKRAPVKTAAGGCRPFAAAGGGGRGGV